MQFLETVEDIRVVFDHLQSMNDPSTLAIRGVLHYILHGYIKEYKICIDKAGTPSAVFVIYNTREYGTTAEKYMDIVTAISSDSQLFEEMMYALALQFNWLHNGVIILCNGNQLQHAGHVMAKSKMTGVHHGPYPIYWYMETLNQELTNGIPEGLTLDVLKDSDLQRVIDGWMPYVQQIPAGIDMLRWCIEKFPNACVRNENGEAVAWMLTNAFGAGGVAYTVPEYRRRGLFDIVDAVRTEKFLEFTKVPPFVGVSDGNVASVKQRVKAGYAKTSAAYGWLVCDPMSTAA